MKLLAGRGLASGHRHHDAHANGDEDADAEPYRRDAREYTRLPQAERHAHDDDEIANEKEVNESHVNGTTICVAAGCVCSVAHTRNVFNGTDAPARAGNDDVRTAAAHPNKQMTVTFNEPVKIPGVNAQVLPAGVYVFRLLDSLSDRHIVQVFNKDESHIYATILAIPNYRLRAADTTPMTFAERAAGDPHAARGSTPSATLTSTSSSRPKRRSRDTEVVESRDPNELTLMTCYPLYFVGSAPRRFVMHGGRGRYS